MSKKEKILILATFLIMVAAVLIIMVGFTGTALPLERVKSINGTIHYIVVGGFWGIIGDDNRRYEPIHLPTELRREGLKAEFDLIIYKNHISLRMWGALVEILEYKIIH